MTTLEILRLRQRHQRLLGSDFIQPAEVVAWLGAMQAQEYAHAKWAIALRLASPTNDATIEDAFNRGEILRTHVLRPTWHFVAPADIRWLLALTAPRVHAINASVVRQHGIDPQWDKRGLKVIAQALAGGRHLTRTELQTALARAKINASGVALAYVIMHAELEGLICSGPRVGKQFTYALLDERVAPAKPLSRDAALATLAQRYFASRGPATVRDFSWWSGLTLKDCRAAADTLDATFARMTLDGEMYCWKPVGTAAKSRPRTFILPDYDEYGMSYRDRRALFDRRDVAPVPAKNGDSYHMFVVGGKIAGTWRKTPKGKSSTIHPTPFFPLKAREQAELTRAIAAWEKFSAVR